MDNVKTFKKQKIFTKGKILTALIITICAITAAIVYFVIMPKMSELRYSKAVSLFQKENYSEAAKIFEKLGEYENSVLMYNDSKALAAVKDEKRIYSPKIKQQYEELVKCGTTVGETVKLGFYEQDGDALSGKEEIEWIVLEEQDEKYLLISKYCLDIIPYNERKEHITWEKSTQRAWLNSIFLETAFYGRNDFIVSSDIENRNNADYGTAGGSDTHDKVFMMSIDECEKYLKGNDELYFATPSQYAKEKGIFINKSNGNSWWWLRSPGSNAAFAAGIGTDGEIVSMGYDVTNTSGGVRPLLRIKLK